MSERKEYSEAVWDYAYRIARGQEAVTVTAEDRGLAPDIVELLEGEGMSFKSLVAEGSIGATLRTFATSDIEFTAPTGRKWRPDIRSAADCEDTPEGWIAALTIMGGALPYTLVLVTNAGHCPQEFRESFSGLRIDVRLVILA